MVYLTKAAPPWKADRARQLSYMHAQKLALLDGPTLDILVGMLVNAIAIPAACVSSPCATRGAWALTNERGAGIGPRRRSR
jgi:hypothetical protein